MKTTVLTIPLLSLALPAAGILSACAKESQTPPPESVQTANATEAPTTTGGTYKVGCNGKVEGAQATAPASDAKCKAQDAAFTYAMPQMRCIAKPLYKWNGKTCESIPASTSEGWGKCTGPDCANLFDAESACKDAFKACAP